MTEQDVARKLAPVYRAYADAIEAGVITFAEFSRRMRRMMVNIANKCGKEVDGEDLRELQVGNELSPALAAALLRECADIFEQD